MPKVESARARLAAPDRHNAGALPRRSSSAPRSSCASAVQLPLTTIYSHIILLPSRLLELRVPQFIAQSPNDGILGRLQGTRKHQAEGDVAQGKRENRWFGSHHIGAPSRPETPLAAVQPLLLLFSPPPCFTIYKAIRILQHAHVCHKITWTKKKQRTQAEPLISWTTAGSSTTKL